MEPESSIRRVVSKVPRNEYGSSPPVDVVVGAWAAAGAGAVEDPASSDVKDGPDADVGDGVYAGGGSLEGTVNAFIPGRSGRRVAGEGFVSGLGLLLPIPPGCNVEGISEGPRNDGVAGVWRSDAFVDEVSERCDDLLLLRPIFRREPKSDLLCLSGGGTVHGFDEGITGDTA
jgi:hypothetical protein